jgi:transposase
MAEKRKTYTAEFKQEAVRLIMDQRYGVAETARHLGINTNMLRRLTLEQEELRHLRAENKRLKMERDILKNAMRFFVNEPK